MAEQAGPEPQAAGDWDVYWRGTSENAAHLEGGPQEVVLEDFWNALFEQHSPPGRDHRVLDLACGNGAVTGFALAVNPQLFMCSLDYSLSAVSELQKRHSTTLGVAGDASHTPFENATFDMVVSQFGIEYAGPGSIGEAARLVAPAGILALIIHLRDGAIFGECAANLATIDEIRDSQLLELTGAAFKAGFALNAGRGSVEAFRAAEQRFTPAVRGLEKILKGRESAVATGLAARLYGDIAHMYKRISAYDEKDISSWIENMTGELEAYRGRMSSMLNAALSEEEFESETTQLQSAGFLLVDHRAMKMGADSDPAAWVLVCRRE